MKRITLPLLALVAMLAQASVAQAENISIRVSYGEGRNGLTFSPVRAETGQFGLTPRMAAIGEGAHWRVVARNAQGKVLHETLVRNGQQRHVEVFDPKTGAIAHAGNVKQDTGAFEVSLPYDPEVASIEVLAPAQSGHGKAATAPGTLAKFERAALQKLVNSGKQSHTRALTVGAAPATTATTILETGPSATRMDYVFVGDGYTAAEQDKWRADATKVINGFLADPLFAANRNAMNVRRVDVASNQSGADEIDKGIYKDTAMDGAFGCFNLERLLCVDEQKTYNVVGSVLAPDKRDVIIVVANSTRYGGSGAAIATLSMHASATEVALHEIGHTAFKLADEYEYGDCNLSVEPVEANVSRNWQRNVKWGSQISANTPVPTTAGTYANGTVGTFVGAQYCGTGKYRPTENSRMRTLGFPWHAVNERLVGNVFAQYKTLYASVTGTLASGGFNYVPSAAPGYLQTAAGTITLQLTGPAGTDFDLELYKYVNGAWTRVASSTGSSSAESISYAAAAGYYYFKVLSYSGSGSYTLKYWAPAS
jgi:hypothetical protein